jgi:hypothetical protein
MPLTLEYFDISCWKCWPGLPSFPRNIRSENEPPTKPGYIKHLNRSQPKPVAPPSTWQDAGVPSRFQQV